MSILVIRCKHHHRDMGLPVRVQQIVQDGDGQRVMRLLTNENGAIAKGPWERTARPFATGLYCQQCLNEGKRKPLPVDEEDWPDLEIDDRPVLFTPPEEFDVDRAVAGLLGTYPTSGCYVHELPATEPEYADNGLIDRLTPSLQHALRRNVLGPDGRLYRFQADAMAAALDGRDVIVTTPTASGKTLTYLLPVLDRLLRDPQATALYLSPLVALTEDQLNAITQLDSSGTDWEAKGKRFSQYSVCRSLEFGSQTLTVARYDGTVLRGDRQTIREAQPRYLLTTPDMLHLALLGGAFSPTLWQYFFKNLRFVIVDEMHTYKGTFGASFANLMRRLRRVCRVNGISPQFISASATITNPAKTAEDLTGRRPVVVDGGLSGGPQKRRKLVLWHDEEDDDRRALSTQAKNMLLFCLRNRIRTIAFARSISEINDIYRFTTAELRESKQEELTITPFMRELKGDHKRQVIHDLKTGKLHAVISTTALSMGVDIGSLSAAVIIGFPGSIASLWQQAGRAGRSGEGLIVLIADTNPLDQFFVNHPEVLFDIGAEPVYCNPDNPYIVRSHLLRAAGEVPLSPTDIDMFGQTARQLAEDLEQAGVLEREANSGNLVPSSRGREEDLLQLRNLNFSIDVLIESSRDTVVQVDAARAQRALHKYAHYQHLDRYFQVVHNDVNFRTQRGEILVKELERPEYTTTAKVERQVEILSEVATQNGAHYDAGFGFVRSRTDVVGYYKVPLFSRNEPFVYQPLGMAAPDPFEYETHGMWLTFDEALFGLAPATECAAGLYSLAQAVRLAVAVEELTDPSDIIAVSWMPDAASHAASILIHDSTPGGIGIVEAAFTKLDRVIQRALMILEECPYCSKHPESRGCPRCVTAQYGDEDSINRTVAIRLGHQVLA